MTNIRVRKKRYEREILKDMKRYLTSALAELTETNLHETLIHSNGGKFWINKKNSTFQVTKIKALNLQDRYVENWNG